MRVLVNTLTVEGPRTGIGHYTSELVSAVRRHQGDESVGTFPTGWLRHARACWARKRPAESSSGSPNWRDRLRQAAQSRVVSLVRLCGQALIRSGFRTAIRRGAFDLYHEPNFI